MKTLLTLQFFAGIFLILSLVSTAAFAQQNPRELFEQARMLDEGNQSLTEAIALYRQVATLSTDQRKLAAEAQLRVGLLYERLGQTAEAQRAFAAVVNEYTDQTEAVRQAQSRMAAARVDEEAASDIIIRQVWAGPEVDVTGAPSPDGRYLSFVDWETGDLAVRDLKTGRNRHLTNKGSWNESSEFAYYSRISPDGMQVAYAWFNEDLFFDLRLISFDGSGLRVLYRNEELAYLQPFDWSQDGKHILALFSRNDRTRQIVLVSVADGSVRVLKTLDWRSPQKMSLSPDGHYIVYDFPPQEDAPERDLFLLSTDGSREIPLAAHPANDLFPVWTPDGKGILFGSDRTGTLDFWLLSMSDGNAQGSPELVKKGMGRLSPMGFTRDGAFYYILPTGIRDVYVATLDLAGGRLLEPPTPVTQRFVGANRNPDWSPDGRFLAFVSQRGSVSGERILVIRTVETGEERELRPALTSFNRPRWSPDGRTILVVGKDNKNRTGLYGIDVQTGDVTTIVQHELGYVQHPAWSPDGKAVYYLRYDPTASSHLRILGRDLETGQEKAVFDPGPKAGIGNMSLSPDGRQVVFTINDGRSTIIRVVGVTGGAPRELLSVKNPAGVIPLAWTPDGRHLLFAKSDSTRSQEQIFELWHIPVEGGEPQKHELAMERLFDLRIHPDGRRLAFTAGQNKAEIWVMENFLTEDNDTQ